MSDHEAVGAALIAHNDALTGHRAAVERLTAIGKMIGRLTDTKLAVEDWKTASEEVDLRRAGGTLCGDDNPIVPHRCPMFEQVAHGIKKRDVSAAVRKVALKHLKDLGLDPAHWK